MRRPAWARLQAGLRSTEMQHGDAVKPAPRGHGQGMSLRKKTFLMVVAVLFSLIALSYLVSWLALQGEFAEFEAQIVSRNVERAIHALNNEQAAMRSTARNWGDRDDTYAFIQDPSSDYIDELLTDPALMNLRASFMAFLDTTGHVVHAKAVNLDTGQAAEAPAALRGQLPDPLVNVSGPDDGFVGLITLPDGVALVAGSPILKHDGTGPRRGTVVVGRLLTPAEVARLGHVALLDLHVYPREEAALPREEAGAMAVFSGTRHVVVLPLDEETIAGYAAIEDLAGNPSILLRVAMPRGAYEFRERTRLFLLGVLLLVGVLATVTTLGVLEGQVLARVMRLDRAVDEIARRHAPSARLALDSRADEITALTCAINDMLEALEKGEQRYRSIVDNFHGIVFRARPDALPELAHGNVQGITGYTEDEFLSGAVRWTDIVLPDDLPLLKDAWNGLADGTRSSVSRQYRIRRRDGETRWVQDYSQAIHGLDDTVAAIQSVTYDITDRVRAEHDLQESLQATADIVRTIPAGLYTYRYEPPDRLILLDGNAEAERITGLRINELRGQDFHKIWPGERSGEILQSYLHAVRTGETFETEELEYSDNRISGAFRIRAFRLPGSKLAVAFENITSQKTAEIERQRLEEQLHHAQKMEAVGQLAGGVAHDFNNLLSGILGYASLLKLEAEADSTVHEAARTIEQAAERAADLTRQLLGFARRGKLQNVPVDLHETVQEVVQLLGRTLDKNIRIVQRLLAPRSVVMGDPNQLQQILVNLALNARDAMPEGGELTFQSGIEEVADAPEALSHMQPRPHLVITVSDQGYGIPRENLGRIFEPFFTTKEQGKGTGMGLAMVYGIVRNHGGFVRVSSEPGAGAAFRVYLPASPVELSGDSAPAAAPQPVRGAARVLLVDDEAVIRNMGSTVLTRLGYAVATAASGREAVEYYRQHADEVDLVIVDMVMPEMGGLDCFRALKEINPGVRAILSSGYGFDGKASELLDEGMLGFIQKPYRVADLSVAVAKALSIGKV